MGDYMSKLNTSVMSLFACFFCSHSYAGSYADFVGSPVVTYHYYSAHPGLLVAQKSMTAPPTHV